MSEGSSISDAEESQYDLDKDEVLNAQEELLLCLDDVQTEGNFSTASTSLAFPNPGLHIRGHGLISLPLREEDAKSIIALSRQAPFGRKDETVVDTSFRNTWELDSSQFDFKNPKWVEYVQRLTKQASMDLGVKGSCHAELYKLLLYEEGAFFKAHKDSEKTAGMFGSMVICLPSPHEGGEVHLTHAGELQTLSTAPHSHFDLSMMAWYADVTHEVKPLTSGYRLVLTYNLIQDSTQEKQSATLLRVKRDRLSQAIQRCNENIHDGDYYAYILDHRYTPSSLGLGSMKGRDRAVGQYLTNVCADLDFYVLFANLTASLRDEDDFDEDEEEDYIQLDLVVTPTGETVASSVYIEKHAILGDNPFDGNYDSEEEGEYTGNESMPSSFRYHKSVAIVIRKQKLRRIAGVGDRHYMQQILAFVIQNLRSRPDNESEKVVAREILSKTTRALTTLYAKGNDRQAYRSYSMEIEASKSKAQFEPVLEKLKELSGLLDQEDILRSVISGMAIEPAWPDGIFRLIGDELSKSAPESKEWNVSAWKSWFMTSLSSSKTYTELYNLYLVLTKTSRMISSEPLQQSFIAWAREEVHATCATIRAFRAEDSTQVIQLLKLDPAIWPRMSNTIDDCGDSATIPQLLLQLQKASHSSGELTSAFEGMLRNHAESLCPAPTTHVSAWNKDLQDELRDRASWQHGIFGQEVHYWDRKTTMSWPIDHSIGFSLLFDHTCQMNNQEYALAMASSLDLRLPTNDSQRHAFWDSEHFRLTRFITAAARAVNQSQNESIRQASQEFFVTSLTEHAAWLGSKAPAEPTNWSQEDQWRDHTHCEDARECAKVKAFLKSPILTTQSFSARESIRKHIQNLLDSRWFRFETIKTASPYTLVVTKTHKKHEESCKSWPYKLQKVKNALQPLQGSFIKELLSPSEYQSFVLLDRLPTIPPLMAIDVNSRNAYNKRPGASAMTGEESRYKKRKVEVVDLCDDD